MARYTAFSRLRPFDRDLEFVVCKGMKLDGKVLAVGAVVDKSVLSTRRLRQLYETRKVAPVSIDEMQVNGVAKPPVFEKMKTESVRSFLNTRNVVIRAGWKREQLIKKAYQLWKAENGQPA